MLDKLLTANQIKSQIFLSQKITVQVRKWFFHLKTAERVHNVFFYTKCSREIGYIVYNGESLKVLKYCNEKATKAACVAQLIKGV